MPVSLLLDSNLLSCEIQNRHGSFIWWYLLSSEEYYHLECAQDTVVMNPDINNWKGAKGRTNFIDMSLVQLCQEAEFNTPQEAIGLDRRWIDTCLARSGWNSESACLLVTPGNRPLDRVGMAKASMGSFGNKLLSKGVCSLETLVARNMLSWFPYIPPHVPQPCRPHAMD